MPNNNQPAAVGAAAPAQGEQEEQSPFKKIISLVQVRFLPLTQGRTTLIQPSQRVLLIWTLSQLGSCVPYRPYALSQSILY